MVRSLARRLLESQAFRCRATLLAGAVWLLAPTASWAGPTNDDCAGALLVACGDTILGDTTLATPDSAPLCVTEDGMGGGLWYRLVGTGDIVVLATCNPGTTFNTRIRVYTGGCADLRCVAGNDTIFDCPIGISRSETSFISEAGKEYWILVHGSGPSEGTFQLSVDCLDSTGINGPDVTYSECEEIHNAGAIGGVRAYSFQSQTCNVGDFDLLWGDNTPLFATNAYRLVEGRLLQIGMSWVKNGVGATALDGCGPPCTGSFAGEILPPGCRDVYSAVFNSLQSNLGPRSQIDAFTGEYSGATPGGADLLDRRLQIPEADLTDPTALYFLEGMYVALDDAAAGNATNNASYKRFTVDTMSFDLAPQGDMEVGSPAIHAWRDHGLGLDTPDPTVTIQAVDVPVEGRFFVGSKATDLGGGQWRYDYAVFNLNSHRSAGSWRVPLPAGVAVDGVGFHDADYHSGEPFDPTDWSAVVGAFDITWSSPETYAENPDGNALRFGTMYNFWFEADAPPSPVNSTIGLFRPGTPDSVVVTVDGPSGLVSFIRGDGNGDANFNGIVDAIFILDYQFQGGAPPPCLESADADGNSTFNGLVDALFVLTHQFQGGAAPPAPYPDCGTDPNPESSLGCDPNGCL